MNKKKLRVVLTMLVMMVAFSFAGLTAEAATTKKMTLYVGEKYTYRYFGLGTIKSVKSSKSSVVTAKKKKGKYNEMTAKKKGSATVTVKGSRGTYKYKITVKSKPKFEVKFERRADGYVTVKVNNKSSVYCNNVKVEGMLQVRRLLQRQHICII